MKLGAFWSLVAVAHGASTDEVPASEASTLEAAVSALEAQALSFTDQLSANLQTIFDQQVVRINEQRELLEVVMNENLAEKEALLDGYLDGFTARVARDTSSIQNQISLEIHNYRLEKEVAITSAFTTFSETGTAFGTAQLAEISAKSQEVDALAACLATHNEYATDPRSGADIIFANAEYMTANECAQNSDDCSVNAGCINTSGSFQCLCNDGFVGDGKVCVDINECREPGRCGTGESCINREGGFSCQCPFGTSGTDCATFSEETLYCSYTDCQEGSSCGMIGPTYAVCTCVNDISGGLDCSSELDSCALGNHACGTDAYGIDSRSYSKCVDTTGFPTCTCIDGYSGHPNCVENDPCAGNPCDTKDPDATCIQNADGTAHFCTCSLGYSGVDCTDVDFCLVYSNKGAALTTEEVRWPNVHINCPSYAYCNSLTNDYECICPPGVTSSSPSSPCDTLPTEKWRFVMVLGFNEDLDISSAQTKINNQLAAQNMDAYFAKFEVQKKIEDIPLTTESLGFYIGNTWSDHWDDGNDEPIDYSNLGDIEYGVY